MGFLNQTGPVFTASRHTADRPASLVTGLFRTTLSAFVANGQPGNSYADTRGINEPDAAARREADASSRFVAAAPELGASPLGCMAHQHCVWCCCPNLHTQAGMHLAANSRCLVWSMSFMYSSSKKCLFLQMHQRIHRPHANEATLQDPSSQQCIHAALRQDLNMQIC